MCTSNTITQQYLDVVLSLIVVASYSLEILHKEYDGNKKSKENHAAERELLDA